MANDGMSRRDFMRKTSGVAGATLIGRSVMLEAASPGPMPQQIPPSETLRFGIIGVGMRGHSLLSTAVKLPGIQCVAACELYDGRTELAREIVKKPILATRRYQDLLDNKEIDCLIAAVPDHWHERIVVDACNAGKDIYCEKPMTHHVAEGFNMIAAAQKNNRIVQIGSQRRSSVVYAKAKELYEQGKIGDVCLVEAQLGRNNPCGAWEYAVPPDLSPATLDWETWLGSAPKRPFDKLRWTRWRCYRDYGEGIPGDLFVHSLTGIHYMMGVEAPAERGLSVGGLFRWKDGRDVPDVMSTLYEYPNFRAWVRVTLNTSRAETTRLMGTGGLLEVSDDAVHFQPQDGKDHGPCAMAWPEKMSASYAENWEREHTTPPGTAQPVEFESYYAPPGYDATRDHLWNFFQSVKTRRPSVEDAQFGNNTAIGCHLANYSYFNKSMAVWDASARSIRS